jgi:DNA polymerase-3 subunit gamma/tau
MLANLELPSTRMLLSQQAELVRLDAQRAVVRVAPNWLSMVQTRLPLLKQAAERTLGSARQVLLESGQPQAPSAAQAPPVAQAPSVAQAPPPPQPRPQASVPPPVPQAPQSYIEDRLRSHARRLADFFNGAVVAEPEDEGDGEAA